MIQSALARSHYQSSAKHARVASASGHQLISILFEELIDLLDEICVIHARGKGRATTDQRVMALTIVDSLLMSLDLEKGGEVGRNLQRIYVQVRQLIASENLALQSEHTKAAREVMFEIADAWKRMEAA